VRQLDELITESMGFSNSCGVTGQTYSRKTDFAGLAALSGLAQSAGEMATGLRLLAHLKEIEEPFGKQQIGSSAVAYKRNPRRSERLCALSRFLRGLLMNPAETAATQRLERTLDDSANRQLSTSQAFLIAAGVFS
jgi:adenylosuccinate lyase